MKFAKVFSPETFTLYGTLVPQASLSRLGQVVKECGGWTLVCIEYRVHRVHSTEYRVESTKYRVHSVQSTDFTEYTLCRVQSTQSTEYRVHSAECTEYRVQST